MDWSCVGEVEGREDRTRRHEREEELKEETKVSHFPFLHPITPFQETKATAHRSRSAMAKHASIICSFALVVVLLAQVYAAENEVNFIFAGMIPKTSPCPTCEDVMGPIYLGVLDAWYALFYVLYFHV